MSLRSPTCTDNLYVFPSVRVADKTWLIVPPLLQAVFEPSAASAASWAAVGLNSPAAPDVVQPATDEVYAPSASTVVSNPALTTVIGAVAAAAVAAGTSMPTSIANATPIRREVAFFMVWFLFMVVSTSLVTVYRCWAEADRSACM